MKNLLVLLVTLFSVNAFAFDPSEEGSGDSFISCYGYHHGSYLDFYSNADATKIAIEVSHDGELESGQDWPLYNITKVQKADVVLAPADYNQTLNDVVPAMNGKTQYDFVFVEADGPNNSKLQLNLNNWFGHSYLVTDGFVEPLTCEIPQH